MRIQIISSINTNTSIMMIKLRAKTVICIAFNINLRHRNTVYTILGKTSVTQIISGEKTLILPLSSSILLMRESAFVYQHFNIF